MTTRKLLCAALAAIAYVSFAANLVPEDRRDFEVPFNGEGKMGMVYTPVFFKQPITCSHS